ncbi:MAG: hypothetical protein U5L98_15945 [Halomonas sp.]|uniref:hypothetical protein n=1 Tax=Halomonas sp. TaxID=1486246 RepID=UPI002ACD4C4E|nr:hypothetical protein [Halomonas sp.]MDZ7854082.1 hypothetical protein [Halomonas sp.]
MHKIRDPDEILAFLYRRIGQLHGEDADEEVIFSRIEARAGSRKEAYRWYRQTPIPALGDLTAQQLVARGRVADVLSYVEHIEHRGYA